jgi:hypothetical protein
MITISEMLMNKNNRTLQGKLILLIGILLSLSACSSPTPQVQVVEITRLVPQTVVVTQVVTQIVTVMVPAPTATLIPPTPTSEEFSYYYPFPNSQCGLSIIHVGDEVYVNYFGPSDTNFLRTDPDTGSIINVVAVAHNGARMVVVGGPVCSYNLIMWQVKMDDGNIYWTAEGNGKDFWLIPY